MEKTMWKALWSAAFGDDGWIDSFFRTAYRPENTLAIFREGQLAAGLAWQLQCVSRALGEVKMYSNENDPQYYGDIYSFLVRVGGSPRRYDKKGVYLITEGAAA